VTLYSFSLRGHSKLYKPSDFTELEIAPYRERRDLFSFSLCIFTHKTGIVMSSLVYRDVVRLN
jgi:hypothetical protein